ncbi:MULE transposase domain protein [Aquisphaera giovannonii]|uniref:MULE transposase domain protein n=1 Tax=Aquisphaera giovannonii TaxID=406548 RepID=A0A5B9VYR0_9BACT|nr:transposase [Aquisphaera giovannonii]QEH32919.1 MULE transposase domain protein [Aquisphaera giovannonii]QEH33081.1 MULE transposase domain protein [Aquisphaera giovannonii]QEH36751.1 MULE transposase domain protein [Aquisphaera giovannonii]
MGTEAPTPIVIPVRCAPKKAPCPRCGKRGRRKRTITRRVRTVTYKAVAYLEVTYGEYAARCECSTTFRNTHEGVIPRAAYDNKVRDLVLDRILKDGMSVERTLRSLRRDFLLDPSSGFVYDVLRDRAAQLDMATHRREVLDRFSGALCVDELHLGRFTLLLATDPLNDLPVAFALVAANDQSHMRRFLGNLKTWGLAPEVVVTDGSNLYPAVLAELWPDAAHQLCVFHVIKDINELILDAVRRMRTAMGRRGKAGRKKKRGRKGAKAKAAAKRRGLTVKEKAHFVFKHRHLIVKRRENLTEAERGDLKRALEYPPALATLRRFADRIYWVFDTPKDRHQAACRRSALVRDPAFLAVPELVKAMEQLDEGKFAKLMAYLNDPESRRVRTNNHVERTNRVFRFLEKVRYKWRRRRTLVRFVALTLDGIWREWTRAETRGREVPDEAGCGESQTQTTQQSSQSA